MSLIIHAAHWQEIDPATWPGQYFSPEEVADNRDGSVKVCTTTLAAADQLRKAVNAPLPVNSWYRTAEHDASIGGAGVHTTGKGLDLGVSGSLAFRVIAEAPRFGFTGIGVSQRGPHGKRFIHLDTIAAGGRHPRPWVWSYA